MSDAAGARRLERDRASYALAYIRAATAIAPTAETST